jgi:rare lipoprotein A
MQARTAFLIGFLASAAGIPLAHAASLPEAPQAAPAAQAALPGTAKAALPGTAQGAQPGTAQAALPGTAVPETVLDSGEATWYGPRHAGRRTTSGERFDPRRMTAAHPSLPLGTIVRVTDVATGRSVIVRVNDREPPHGVRCIDLSEGAATALGIHGRGVAEVTLSAVKTDEAPVEVAEAPDDSAPIDGPRATSPHGRRHRHRAAR